MRLRVLFALMIGLELTLYAAVPVAATPLLRHGIPFRETLKAADDTDTHLIILGSKGRSAFRELLTGSTAENIVRLSPQPVLVVRCPQVG